MEDRDIFDTGIGELFYTIINLSKYSEEEYSAITGKAEMTEEIFEDCIQTALSLCDLGTIKSLSKQYPEFAKKSKHIPDKFLP